MVQGSRVVQINLDTRKMLARARCHTEFGQGSRGFDIHSFRLPSESG